MPNTLLHREGLSLEQTAETIEMVRDLGLQWDFHKKTGFPQERYEAIQKAAGEIIAGYLEVPEEDLTPFDIKSICSVGYKGSLLSTWDGTDKEKGTIGVHFKFDDKTGIDIVRFGFTMGFATTPEVKCKGFKGEPYSYPLVKMVNQGWKEGRDAGQYDLFVSAVENYVPVQNEGPEMVQKARDYQDKLVRLLGR